MKVTKTLVMWSF